MHTPATLVRLIVVLALVANGLPASAQLDDPLSWFTKLDPLLQRRALAPSGQSRIIARAVDASALLSLGPLIQQAGGTLGRSLPVINGQVAVVPDQALPAIAGSSLVEHVSFDRLMAGSMARTGAAVGATAIREQFGYDGAGVGVAVIDSGVTAWHDDLGDGTGTLQRVDRFVDFVNGREAPYDDYGHGTHVAGIIAGNGFDSNGARSGIAPATRLIVLKVLDGSGAGRISDCIAALGYVVAHRDDFNIRVINLSVATGVYESYNSDPLTLAARRAVSAGIVVVASAGNYGRGPQGQIQYGGVTAPGNAPWVVTAGAATHMGTIDRADDAVALFSSRGPTAIDYAGKPDLVAPGVGLESLSDPASAFYTTKSRYLLSGTAPTAYLPYLSLSGTSMSSPVVAGTVALMLQANPTLTPTQVKAILQYTAETYPGYDALTQGAGFLNARAAVELARWSGSAAAKGETVDWGGMCATASCDDAAARWHRRVDDSRYAGATSDGDTVVWGTDGDAGDTVVWGTSGCADPACEPPVWNAP